MSWVATWPGALAAYGITLAVFIAGWAIACTPGRRQQRAQEAAELADADHRARFARLAAALEATARENGWDR